MIYIGCMVIFQFDEDVFAEVIEDALTAASFFLLPLLAVLVDAINKKMESRKSKKRKDQKKAEVGLDLSLLKVLEGNGVIVPDDIILITKTPDGNVIWLQNGDETFGLEHIKNRYSNLFTTHGVFDIPNFLKLILQFDPIRTGIESEGPYADYVVNGTNFRLVHRTNGCIVSFFPVEEAEDPERTEGQVSWIV